MNDQELREIPYAKESIFNGAIFNVERWQVTCPNGHSAPREIVLHRGAAAVIPVYEDGTTLMVRQHRVSVDRVTLEIPAGKLDSWDEDPYDCAVRELEEETGLKAERYTLLTSVLTTPGFCTEKIAIYLAEGLTQGETHPDEDEFLGLVRIPLEDAVSMIMRGEIRDGKTISGLLMAKMLLDSRKEQTK